MGGYFSGRHGWRATCESRLSIDVRRWAREGYLANRSYFSWQWTIDGERRSSIGIWVDQQAARIELDYRNDGELYRYPVQLTSTPCHFGGRRTWFRCPALGCGRRAGKLYLGSRYFACRRCYGLAYQSQCYSPRDRALSQAGKLRLRLGGSQAISDPFPDKPAKMRWRTYERLRARCDRYEAICDAGLWALLERFQALG